MRNVGCESGRIPAVGLDAEKVHVEEGIELGCDMDGLGETNGKKLWGHNRRRGALCSRGRKDKGNSIDAIRVFGNLIRIAP